MKKGALQIHSQNILPIIKKWLYSEKDIFLRELVSNASDAILKLSLMKKAVAPSIHVKVDKTNHTITISDTGIGMTAEETEKYLAQIAFSGAEEFIKAYQTNDAFIGHFGLGFYSAYMVAEKVEVHTLSHQEGALSAIWSCDGSSEYELKEGSKTTVGTDVTLFINKENEEFLDEKRLLDLLKRFCLFFPYPIFLNDTLVNNKEPLWLKNPSECSKQDYLDFYQLLYPFEEEPLFWVHLNVDYPFHVKGILYFPRIRKDLDLNKSYVRLYCNRVFVSDDCKDILPEYLRLLKGAIDSPDIPLNVSRSYLQVDKTVRALSSHISKKVVDTLSTLFKTDRERFTSIWPDVEFICKLGLLNDEKFAEKAREFLVWKTTKGSWTTVSEYLVNHKDQIFYTDEEQQESSLLQLYEARGIEVLTAKMPLDAAIMAHLEKQISPVKFCRIDAAAHTHIIDASKEKTLLDSDGKTESAKLADFIRKSLETQQVAVEAKSLATAEIPGFIAMQEEERRFRDYLTRMSQEPVPAGMAKPTFVINTNNPLVNSIYSLRNSQPELSKMMVQQLYDLAMLEQKEMDAKELKAFVVKSTALLAQVSQLLPNNTVVIEAL